MPQKLAGKVALVTGASKGIGAAIAKQLAAEGAAVVVNYSSSASGAQKVVKDITEAGGKAVMIQANVANESDIVRLIAETKAAYGKLDILVNNAGVYEFAALEAITAEHYHKIFNLNVLGLLLATREAVKIFPQSGGVIINVSSGITTVTPPNTAVYAGTKGAVDAITGVLAKELAPRKIRVNAINPGMIETEGIGALGEAEAQMRKWIESAAPLARVGKPHEIATAVTFLATDDSSYMTGGKLFVTGGL